MREIKFRVWEMSPYGNAMRYVDLYWFEESFIREWPADNDGPWTGKYELMQYTGLKDKTGKEIYEGDIIAWAGAYDHKMVVRWIEKGLYFDVPLQWIQDIEIIGNIYENNELLSEVRP